MYQPAKILAIDDEEIVRESWRRVLVSDGHTVSVACTADEAMRMLAGEHFDVVLLDLKLPGFGGMHLLRAIRRLAPKTEIVVITGFPSLENAKESIRLGAFDYVTKPLVPRALSNVVSQVLTCKPWKVQER